MANDGTTLGRARWQFSLQTLFLATAVCGVFLGSLPWLRSAEDDWRLLLWFWEPLVGFFEPEEAVLYVGFFVPPLLSLALFGWVVIRLVRKRPCPWTLVLFSAYMGVTAILTAAYFADFYLLEVEAQRMLVAMTLAAVASFLEIALRRSVRGHFTTAWLALATCLGYWIPIFCVYEGFSHS
jgi:hypothetical protein